jgi:hypothetical protein
MLTSKDPWYVRTVFAGYVLPMGSNSAIEGAPMALLTFDTLPSVAAEYAPAMRNAATRGHETLQVIIACRLRELSAERIDDV